MATERRLTMHNGRSHKGGKVFSAKHNEHLENGNWDAKKRGECYFWKSKACPGENFDEGEKNFYERYFRKSLDLQNERHKKSRHLERIKTMDDYRKSKNYCPEETLFYLGDKENCAPREQLLEVMKEYIRWHTKEYPLAKILNFSLHADEKGAPHVHLRKIWMAKDGEGNWMVGQNKSLEQMGVEIPHPDEPIDAQNNAKTTYTKACREKLISMCKERGIELITEPRPKEESGKTRSEFIADNIYKPYIEAIERLMEQYKALTPKQQTKERSILDMIEKSGRIFGSKNPKEIREATTALKKESARLEERYFAPVEEPEGWEYD